MNSLSLNLSNRAAAGEQFWITLEQELPDALATVAEAAEVIDELFELDPCTPAPEEETDTPEKSLEEILEAARAALDNVLLDNQDTLCTDENGCFPATVRVYRSHQSRPYTLLIQGGEEVSTVLGKVDIVAKTVAVKDASSVSMDLPADQDISVSWQGPCFSKADGRLEQNPEIVVSGGKVSWGFAISGVLSARYAMPYDLVTIKTTEEDCSVTGLYHLSVDEIDLEPPPDDDEAENLCREIESDIETPVPEMPKCEELILVEERCICTNEVNNSYYKKAPTPCRPGDAAGSEVNRGRTEVTYVGCGTKDEVSESAYYEEKCCHGPHFILPNCKKKYGVYTGNASPDQEEAQSLKRTYGDRLRFIPVGPKSGPCGTKVAEQMVHALQCCEGAPGLLWDFENSADTIAPDSSAVVYVLGGKGKIEPEVPGCGLGLPTREWTISGKDVWFDGNHTTRKTTTDQNCVKIYAGPDACGQVVVYVTDGCSSISGGLRATLGVWVLRDYYLISDRAAGLYGMFSQGSYPASATCFIDDCGSGDYCIPGQKERIQGGWKVVTTACTHIHPATSGAGARYMILCEENQTGGSYTDAMSGISISPMWAPIGAEDGNCADGKWKIHARPHAVAVYEWVC